MNKEQIIDHIQHLINEHIESNYCTDWEQVLECDFYDEICLMKAYDCGRYDTLINLLNEIKQ